jgi:hypothetical protein
VAVVADQASPATLATAETADLQQAAVAVVLRSTMSATAAQAVMAAMALLSLSHSDDERSRRSDSLAVRATRVNVGAAPTALTGAETDYQSGSSGLIRHRGTNPVYLGGANVSTSTGFQLDSGEAVPLDLFSGEVVYGIVASGTERCDVLETSV